MDEWRITADLEDAVKEWRDARKAFFAVPPLGNDPKARVPPEIMIRLGHAEDRLARLSERL